MKQEAMSHEEPEEREQEAMPRASFVPRKNETHTKTPSQIFRTV